jgi:predicted nucleic acid-binding protein
VQFLFDTSVILDVLLGRAPFVREAILLWQAAGSGQIQGHLAATTFTDIHYIVRKQVGQQGALDAVENCLKTFEVRPVNREVLEKALALQGGDFEDNVQIACAVLTVLDGIVTRDEVGFKHSPIPVFTPAEALAALTIGRE